MNTRYYLGNNNNIEPSEEVLQSMLPKFAICNWIRMNGHVNMFEVDNVISIASKNSMPLTVDQYKFVMDNYDKLSKMNNKNE